MSIFSSIVGALLHHSNTTQAATPTATQGAGGQAAPSSAPPSTSKPASAAASSSASAPLQSVDVEAVLSKLAASKGGGGNWRTSIVDLLKLLDLDSSLAARRDLANELNVHAGADGTAEQNIALQKAVMNQLAANGGKVPDSLRRP
jgi:uncharacterized protein DUF3597